MNTSKPKIGAADRMKCATATIAVLRTLELLDTTMTYGQFARAIGLRGMEEEWQAWHRKQVSDVLYLAAAVEDQAKMDEPPLQYDRIVDAQGEAGAGLHRTAKVIVS